jgi:hypothetical protein
MTVTEETSLAPINSEPSNLVRLVEQPTLDLSSVLDLAKVFVQSGYFDGVKSISQAAVKIMAGREFGIGPFASMQGVYIVGGRPAFMAQLLAAKIKNSGRYDYRIVEFPEDHCTIDFFERGRKVGTESFSIKDARRQATKNMEKFPRNMLFARALSNGARFHCAGIFGGAPAYVPEDFGMEQRADGGYDETDVIDPESRLGGDVLAKSTTGAAEPVDDDDDNLGDAPDGDALNSAVPFDLSKPYKVAEVVQATKKGQPFVVTTTTGLRLLCNDQRLYISATSAKQSGADVILKAEMDGEQALLTALEVLS